MDKKMSRAARAAAILGICLLCVCWATATFAAEAKPVTAKPNAITWKMHSGFSPNQFYTRAWNAFAQEVLKRTNGELVITVYPSSVLGFTQPNTLTALRDQIVPIAEISASISEGLMPELKEISVFYLFDTPEKEAKAYAAVRADMEKVFLAKYKVKILATCIGAPTEMFTKKKIDSLDDMKGLKIRTAGAAMANQAKMLGMVPTTIDSKEVGMALERSMVDGLYTSLQGFNDDKFYQYVKVANMVHQSHVKMFIGVNADAFNKLPPAIQTQVQAAAAWLEKEGYNKVRDDDAAIAKKNLAASGVEFFTPPAAVLNAMREVGRKLLDENAAKAGPEAQARLAKMLSAAGVK
ncbi:MAG: TRAP transporter substrate-binding protein DctP [Deltaproteobacteria bacterium]|nr:TRAP transporter substrate-binding protein DctP [Deltaproteobacteria bacterium]